MKTDSMKINKMKTPNPLIAKSQLNPNATLASLSKIEQERFRYVIESVCCEGLPPPKLSSFEPHRTLTSIVADLEIEDEEWS